MRIAGPTVLEFSQLRRGGVGRFRPWMADGRGSCRGRGRFGVGPAMVRILSRREGQLRCHLNIWSANRELTGRRHRLDRHTRRLASGECTMREFNQGSGAGVAAIALSVGLGVGAYAMYGDDDPRPHRIATGRRLAPKMRPEAAAELAASCLVGSEDCNDTPGIEYGDFGRPPNARPKRPIGSSRPRARAKTARPRHTGRAARDRRRRSTVETSVTCTPAYPVQPMIEPSQAAHINSPRLNSTLRLAAGDRRHGSSGLRSGNGQHRLPGSGCLLREFATAVHRGRLRRLVGRSGRVHVHRAMGYSKMATR